MEKVTRKNSIYYNQEWINKLMEENKMDLLPTQKPLYNLSIGETIAIKHAFIKDTPKVTKKNSLLFYKQWVEKYFEEGLTIPRERPKEYSIGEYLEIAYPQLKETQREFYEHIRYM